MKQLSYYLSAFSSSSTTSKKDLIQPSWFVETTVFDKFPAQVQRRVNIVDLFLNFSPEKRRNIHFSILGPMALLIYMIKPISQVVLSLNKLNLIPSMYDPDDFKYPEVLETPTQ